MNLIRFFLLSNLGLFGFSCDKDYGSDDDNLPKVDFSHIILPGFKPSTVNFIKESENGWILQCGV